MKFDPCFSKRKIEAFRHRIPAVHREIRKLAAKRVRFPARVRCMTAAEIREGRKHGAGHGLYIPSGRQIKINASMSAELIYLNFIHENLHHALPDATEARVDRLTEVIARRVKKEEEKMAIRVTRKAYRRKDGTRVKASTFYIKDPGRPGRRARGAKAGPFSRKKGYKPWIKREGSLGEGFLTSMSKVQRHRAINAAMRNAQRSVGKKKAYRRVMGKLMALNRSTELKKKYGGKINESKRYLEQKWGDAPSPKRKRRNGSKKRNGSKPLTHSMGQSGQLAKLRRALRGG